MSCPVNYNIQICSSAKWGFTCKSCYHFRNLTEEESKLLSEFMFKQWKTLIQKAEREEKENMENNKPPVGIIPKKFFEIKRIQDLTRALYEYSNKPTDINDIQFMHEWAEELTERLWQLEFIVDEEASK